MIFHKVIQEISRLQALLSSFIIILSAALNMKSDLHMKSDLQT